MRSDSLGIQSWLLRLNIVLQTLLGVVMAATVYALYLKISQPIADMLDERSQVRTCNTFLG